MCPWTRSTVRSGRTQCVPRVAPSRLATFALAVPARRSEAAAATRRLRMRVLPFDTQSVPAFRTRRKPVASMAQAIELPAHGVGGRGARGQLEEALVVGDSALRV